MNDRDDAPRAPVPPPRAERGPARPFLSAALLGVSTAVLMFAILALASAWWRHQRPPVVVHLPSSVPTEVDLWVGDLAPGVLGVLSTENDDPLVDERADAALNDALGLAGAEGLAYYRLRAFNRGASPATLAIGDGALVVTPRDGSPLPLRTLAAALSGGAGREAPASPAAETLRRLGADRTVLEVPPGAFVSHPVALSRRVPLGEVESVARADGTAFHRRRIPQRQWSGLVASPSLDELKDL
jgi:hypothetical protein